MDIREALLREHSKANTNQIAQYVGQDQALFAELMGIFLGKDPKLVQRSAWVVTEVAMLQPALILPFQRQLVQALMHPLHPAVQRNILKVLAENELPLTEETEGEILNLCFDLLPNPQIPVAIRVHAMQYIANLLPRYPDLAIELRPILEDGMEEGSAGFKSRGKKILKLISKLEQTH